MSGTKRKVEELGGHVLSAAVGDVVARTMSAAVGRYEARASVDDQLERLRTLAIMVHSAVEAAEGVHIRSWWLRRWLWTLRDAALDADEVLRLFRRHRAAEEAAAATAGRQAAVETRNTHTLWSAALRVLRSAKSLLFGGVDDGAVERLGRMVARLEREAMSLGDFLKMLELEIRRSLPVQSESERRPFLIALQLSARLVTQEEVALRIWKDRIRVRRHGRLSSISHEEYVAGVRKMGLLLVRQRIRRALDKLVTRKPPTVAPPAASRPPDLDRLREMVARIRRAVVLGSAEFHGGERWCWLALWRGELQALADRAERVLMLAVPLDSVPVDSVPVDDTGGDGADVMTTPRDHDAGDGDGGLRSTARSVETAEAHLEAFVTLAWLARRQMQTTWRHGGSRDVKGTRLWMFLSVLIIVIITVCLFFSLKS